MESEVAAGRPAAGSRCRVRCPLYVAQQQPATRSSDKNQSLRKPHSPTASTNYYPFVIMMALNLTNFL